MQEEIGKTIDNLLNVKETIYGDLKIFSGEYKVNDQDSTRLYITITWSGWGKVCSSRAATRLIGTKYKESQIDFILFTGVAGSLSNELNQWDIVVPKKLVQYDLDARPFFNKFIIPSLNKDYLTPKEIWYEWIMNSIKKGINKRELKNIRKIHNGLVGTGDKFLSKDVDILELKKNLPKIIAVEMEGAAVAQVAEQENIPWIILRVISDSADDSAANDFSKFISIYSQSSWHIIKNILINFENCPKFNKH